jgi:hypothetical protein
MENDKVSICNSEVGKLYITQPVNPDIIKVTGNSGSTLFTIKPNGEFIPGPGLETNAISEFAKVFYKQMKVFGKSFAETLDEKNERIRELEREIKEIKEHGTSN